jgi:hypothetical protein
MRVKTLAHKNKMGKSKTTNASTSWVPSEFRQTNLTKAQKEGLIAAGDQVVFPHTERIPQAPEQLLGDVSRLSPVRLILSY